MSASFHRAPWSTSLRVLSFLSVAILLLVCASISALVPAWPWGGMPRLLGIYLPLVVLLGAALFVIRGYELDSTELRIQRLLWVTTIPLAGLQRAWHDPTSLFRSLRLFGNGGLFSISGLFWNRNLGRYRAFATHPKRAVVLDLGNRKIVVTPEDPERFLQELRERPGSWSASGKSSATREAPEPLRKRLRDS